MVFKSREEAGKILAKKVQNYKGKKGIVISISRNGVAVGKELANFLEIPLNIIFPKKIAIPGNPDVGIGAATSDGSIALNYPLVNRLRYTPEQIHILADRAQREAREERELLLGRELFPPIFGFNVFLVDEGVSSGYPMLAAIRFAQRNYPRKVIAAVPVISTNAQNLIQSEVDELVCIRVSSTPFFVVSHFYENWWNLSDEEVISYLSQKEASSPSLTSENEGKN